MCTPQCICEKLGGLAFEEVIKAWKYVRHYTEILQKLQVKLRDLVDFTETITREVNEAIGRGDEIQVNVLHWRTDANSLIDNIEQRIGESTTRASISCIACSCPNMVWRYKFSKQAEEKIADAVELIGKYNNFNHQISHPRPRPPELESLSDKNYVNFDSRASIFKDIMEALKDSNVNMIGVFGLGGVGKTTLVKEVGEQMRKDGTFKQVGMAVVSKDLNVKEVQSRLADSLNFKFKAKADDQERRATELWNKFTNGDKYLIILDDIWEGVKMETIGIPCTNDKKGCKVVLTSRNKDLLSIVMKVDRNFSIGMLLSAEAWTLFMKKVGTSIQSQLEIKSLAYEVCKRCKGLPVAINALGEALKGKQKHVWETALNKLDKYMLKNIVDINPSVTASLRLSYDMLRSQDAKSCFLLCCLFVEDAEIPIDDLMRLCVARNLLDQNPSTLDEARNAVRTVVDTLKSASLLTTGGHENVVKIDGVIRDVGILIAREEEAFLVDHGALQWPQNPPNGPSYSSISLIFKNVNEHPDGLVYPELHTLMVANRKLSNHEFPNNFFNGMMQLTVLTISGIHMRQLPSSLAKLKNLRMLYLNECELYDITILKDLKSNLEVLSLSGSSIKELPPEIGQLTSLRVLDLRDCDNLTVIPRGVVSNLSSIEELYFPMAFDKWEATTDEQQDTSNRDNASLEELRESLANTLTTLHIHVPNVKLLPKEDLVFANLKGFMISMGSEFDYSEALISRTCMLKLEGIQLRNEFIPLVEKAEVLVLKSKSSVRPLWLFNKLTVLIIEHFKLKYLFSPTTARGLVHLEVLEVTSCEIMEGIVGFEGQEDEKEITGEVKFSKLKQLKLTSLPNLISFFAEKEEMGTTMGSFSTHDLPLFNEQVIFPVLERLFIDELGNIIKIWDKQSVAIWQEQGSFCQLTYVNVSRCEKLMHVFPSNMHPLLRNLEGLSVRNCETIKGIAEFEGEIDEDGLRNEVAFPALEHLEMVGVLEITDIRDKQAPTEPRKEVESLCKLVDISIQNCDQLLHVFPSHILPQNLQNLYIGNCDMLEVIFSKDPKEEKEAINDDNIVFPRLKEVSLHELPKLKSFYTETQGFFSHKVAFPVLECLHFINLDKITMIWDNQPLSEPEKEAKSFCKLRWIGVGGCNQLEYVLPFYMLPQLKNLQDLQIRECTKVEVIISNNPKEKEAANNTDTIWFPLLKEVRLWGLPNLKSFICSDETQLFFSNKDAFPVLETIHLLPEGTLEFLRNETSTKEVSMEECGTSGKESGHNGEELDEDLKTEEVSMEVAFPVLETLKFKDLDKITSSPSSEKTVPGVKASTTHIPYIVIDSPPESMSTEHEVVMSVLGVEVSTTVSEGQQRAEIAINEKEGEWNASGQIGRPIMSITTSTVIHKIIEDGSFSLSESDYSVFSRKHENLEEPVQPEENGGKNFDGEQNGTNISFPKDYVLAICNAELREPPAEEKWWRPGLILLMETKLSSLPEKPNCPNLQGLSLQNNMRLRRIPSSFFDNMPKLQFLDMSKTGVRKLPASLSKLSELKALFLRDCDNIDELPDGIGNLERIEVLDLWGTQLLKLPNEIAKLSHLRLLRVSFYGADEDSEYGADEDSEYTKLPKVLVSRCVISQLRTLQALSIAVRPGDGRWNESAESITDDVASLGELTYLQFYFPKVGFLTSFMQKSPSWKDGCVRKFKFILGQDIERVVSRVPDDVISEYEKHDRCLRYVNGDDLIPQELEDLLVRVTAFYLDHHCTVKSLSEFGLTNLKELKFCVLRECPKIVNIINNVRKTDGLLPHLEHLSMHYLPRLEKIWKGVVPLGSLDRLKLLSVRKCPKLKFILTEPILQCLSNLEELIVEDCESVKVIIETKGKRVKAGTILPSLKKMKLSYLPKLGMLWNGADLPFEPIVRGCPLFKSST